MLNPPQVSVIIPVFNRPILVHQAISSALEAGKTVPLEILVIDDASTDETWQTLGRYKDPRVHAFRMEMNGGQSIARNRGLELAAGDYVKFLDSDDILAREQLVRETEAMASGADLVVSGWEEVDITGESRLFPAPRFESIVDDVLAGLAVPTSAALYRRRIAPRWDPLLRKLDDWDYFCQAALGAHRIESVAGVAYQLHEHSGARATDASMLTNAREHHRILARMETRLSEEGLLTPARRARLAQYYYKEMRVLSLHDAAAFQAAANHIISLDPAFAPRDEERQWYMRLAARLVGFRNAIALHSGAKRLIVRFRSTH